MSYRKEVMYTMRPLTVLPPIPPQEIMYRMQNIHEKFLPMDEHLRRLKETVDTNMPRRIIGEEGPLPEYQELEIRQSKVLTQLADLKKQVSTLCQFLKQSSGASKSNENNEVKTATDCVPSQMPEQKPVHIKMVVHADPNYLPYSILALQKFWTDVDIRVTSYKHSSVAPSIQLMVPFQRTTNSAAKTIIDLSLIWKETEELEVITGIDNAIIIGESNFLRYLSRLTDTHNYEKIHPEPHILDTVLDWCYTTHRLLKAGGTYKEADFYIVTCNFEKWAKEPEFNIADVALWSLLKQFPTENKPKILNPWWRLCEKTFIDETYIDKCTN